MEQTTKLEAPEVSQEKVNKSTVSDAKKSQENSPSEYDQHVQQKLAWFLQKFREPYHQDKFERRKMAINGQICPFSVSSSAGCREIHVDEGAVGMPIEKLKIIFSRGIDAFFITEQGRVTARFEKGRVTREKTPGYCMNKLISIEDAFERFLAIYRVQSDTRTEAQRAVEP